jgi:hypothetical protein
MNASVKELAAARRRLSRRLGRRGRGKLVAVDRTTGDYVVGDNLDELLAAITRIPRGAAARGLLIFRLGQRAAVELRLLR